jgi:hypothetical protein
LVREGVRIAWKNRKPPLRALKQKPLEDHEIQWMDRAIQDMIRKEVVKVVEKEKVLTSPLFTVPKRDNTSERRPVHNLRFVNRFVQVEKFKMLTFSEVKRALVKGSFMTKVDLKDFFWQVPVHQEDQSRLAFEWRGRKFKFQGLPMGLTSSPRIVTKLFKPVLAELQKRGFKVMIYIDDILIIGSSKEECSRATKETIQLLQELGLRVNFEKSSLVPAQRLVYLGFEIDTADMTIRVPKHKVLNLKSELRKFMRTEQPSARQVATVLGKLNAMADAIFPTRVHTGGLLHFQAFLRRKSWDATAPKSQAAVEDVLWWKENISTMNGKAIIPMPSDLQAGTDASDGQWGGWLRVGNKTHEFGGFFKAEHAKLHINLKELLAIKFLIESAQDLVKGKTISVGVDNTTAMAYANKLGGRKESLAEVAQSLWEVLQSRKSSIQVHYVPGDQNLLADFLSRNQDSRSQFQLNRSLFHKIDERWGPHTIDLFATQQNSLLLRYASWHPSPGADFLDAFSRSWVREKAWVHPPYLLISRVLSHILQDKNPVEVTLVAPWWPAQPWVGTLLGMTVAPPMALPAQTKGGLMILPNSRGWDPKWQTFAWRISNERSRNKAFLRTWHKLWRRHGIPKLISNMTPIGRSGLRSARLNDVAFSLLRISSLSNG